MKVIVCIKKVPDTEAKIKIAADGKSITAAELNFILNPYDEYAVEAALQIKEKSAADVVIYSLGNDAIKEIRNALAMGADSAVFLEDKSYAGDVYATAKTLANALKNEKFDLLLMGKMAVDDGATAVGPMVAEMLGLPCVSSIEHLEMDGQKILARMPVEGGVNVIEVPLPAVLTTDKGLNEPRYPSLKGIMQAKKKAIDTRPTKTEPAKFEVVALTSPPPRPSGRIVGEGVAAVITLVGLLKNEAKVI